jgi:hypothetical protein|tara:strand:- start:75 stop:299 length:225 start_codon:yes stop_codon:yes gene_type:complete
MNLRKRHKKFCDEYDELMKTMPIFLKTYKVLFDDGEITVKSEELSIRYGWVRFITKGEVTHLYKEERVIGVSKD